MTFARGINCNLVVERFSMSENKLLEYKTLSLSQARGMVDAVIFAAQKTITKMIKTPEAIVLMLLSAFVSFFYSSPYIFPILLLLGGLSTSI